MMGTQKRQDLLFSYNVVLERRVPPDHPLRKVKALIDFSFVREEVSGTYGYNGNESVDPEVIMKLMFLLFFDDIKSERELMRQVSYRMDYLWFLDYGLDDVVPDHSVLSKARRLFCLGPFEGFFIRILKQCVEVGIVDGGKLHIDGSLVDADASRDSVVKGSEELISALKRVYREQERKFDYTDEAVVSGADIGGGDIEGRRPSDYKPVNEGLMSRSDPDSAVVSRSGLALRPRYKNHRAVDDMEGVITAVESTSGDVEESSMLIDLIEKSERNTGLKVQTVVGDSQYGTVENFCECGYRGIKAHMADLSESHKDKGQKSGIYPKDEFKYDEDTDSYRCPAGKILKRRRHKKPRRAYEYATSSEVCNECELKARCTRSDYGRSIKRHYDEELINDGRSESRSEEAKKDRRRRKHLMEGSFADATNNHGFKRARWRRLWRQKIQDLLIAACQNIRILIKNLRTDLAIGARKVEEIVTDGLFDVFITRIIGLYGWIRCFWLNMRKRDEELYYKPCHGY